MIPRSTGGRHDVSNLQFL
ncbi:MAG: hypothetical protein DLM72_19265 [Candidatus Nitrosopolaris wilkensis]|nr:MAG: hypothetical protein DLM72_19265 [Candidatus Nitrosopolaris wilkensis]